MSMLMSILEADMPADKAAKLETNFTEGIKTLEPGVVQMFFVKNSWKCRIIVLWENKEAYSMVKSKGTPKAVLMFRYAGIEATALNYDVVNMAKK